jgi:hypothetical protein
MFIAILYHQFIMIKHDKTQRSKKRHETQFLSIPINSGFLTPSRPFKGPPNLQLISIGSQFFTSLLKSLVMMLPTVVRKESPWHKNGRIKQKHDRNLIETWFDAEISRTWNILRMLTNHDIMIHHFTAFHVIIVIWPIYLYIYIHIYPYIVIVIIIMS